MALSVETHIEKARTLLSDFSVPIVLGQMGKVTYKHRVSGNYEVWRLVRFLFSDIVPLKILDQPHEKTNWQIPFLYQGKYPCIATHEKFGFRIYVGADSEEEGRSVAEAIENKLNKALYTSRPIVEHYAEEALACGDIIVENLFKYLRGPYDYFRKMALARKRAIEHGRSKSSPNSWYKKHLEQTYYEQATYFAFFSMIEHLCVLFLAYRNISERKDVGAFSALKWSQKFKLVFDIRQPEFRDIYDRLVGIARYRRNPAAHGYSHTVFEFYLEGARHKISVSLDEKDVSVRWRKQEDNFNALESFMLLVKTHKTTKNIFAYILSGLNVSFANHSLGENDSVARMSASDLREHIEGMLRMSDDMENMDW